MLWCHALLRRPLRRHDPGHLETLLLRHHGPLHELALLRHGGSLRLLRSHWALLRRDLWLMTLGTLHAWCPLTLLHSLHLHLGPP